MSKTIRIHTSFGPICKSLVFDKAAPFKQNIKDILESFGIPKEEHSKYALKLVNGGLVEQNDVLLHEDKVAIIPLQEIIAKVSQDSMLKSECNDATNDGVKTEDTNQALLEAINSIHLKDFHSIFKQANQKNKELVKQEMKSTEKKAGKQLNGDKQKMERIQYKSLLKKRMKRTEEGNVGGN